LTFLFINGLIRRDATQVKLVKSALHLAFGSPRSHFAAAALSAKNSKQSSQSPREILTTPIHVRVSRGMDKFVSKERLGLICGLFQKSVAVLQCIQPLGFRNELSHHVHLCVSLFLSLYFFG
jgi:hypothetical protein